MLLALLRARPRHGYDLLAALGDAFGPEYRPSAGSVYPALAALEEEGLIAPTQHDDRRVYRLTPVGERSLEERSAALGAVEARTGVDLSVGTLEPLLSAFSDRVRRCADGADPQAVEDVLEEAARRIEAIATRAQEGS